MFRILESAANVCRAEDRCCQDALRVLTRVVNDLEGEEVAEETAEATGAKEEPPNEAD